MAKSRSVGLQIVIAGDPASTTTYVYCMKERAESLLVRSFLSAIASSHQADARRRRTQSPDRDAVEVGP